MQIRDFWYLLQLYLFQTTQLTEAERRIERAKKFGVDLSATDKKVLRAERLVT